jgi:uncharacterized protein (TIGR00251 family)
LSGAPGGWRLQVVVQPGAPRDAVAGEYDGRLNLRIAAPAIEGRANEALERFLAETLGVARSAVCVERGETGRRKRVRLDIPLAAGVLLERLGVKPAA